MVGMRESSQRSSGLRPNNRRTIPSCFRCHKPPIQNHCYQGFFLTFKRRALRLLPPLLTSQVCSKGWIIVGASKQTKSIIHYENRNAKISLASSFNHYCCCLLACTSALTVRALNVITFEDIPGMANAPETPVPTQSQLSTQYLPTLGVSFSSGSSYVAVVDVVNAAISGTNTIGGSTPSGNLTYSSAYPIVATFLDPGNPSTSATTDFVSLRCDAVGSDLNVTLNAYGINGNLLTSYTTLDVGGETLQVSASGIHSVQFIGTDDGHGARWIISALILSFLSRNLRLVLYCSLLELSFTESGEKADMPRFVNR